MLDPMSLTVLQTVFSSASCAVYRVLLAAMGLAGCALLLPGRNKS